MGKLPMSLIFDSEHSVFEDELLAPCCMRKVISALKSLDKPVTTQIYKGYIVPRNLVDSPSRISVEKGKSSSVTFTPDMKLYRILLADFSESISIIYSSVDSKDLLTRLISSEVWVVTLASVDEQNIKTLDNAMKQFSPYLGSCVIDTGNPFHMNLLVNTFIDGLFFKDNFLYVRGGFSEDENDEILGIVSEYDSENLPVLLDYDDFYEKAPNAIVPSQTSSRGRESLNRYWANKKQNLHQRVAEELCDKIYKIDSLQPFDFSTELIDEERDVVIEDEKLKNYLLNLDHPDGKSKAIFFRDVLSITKNDWRYLKDQLEQGIRTAPIFKVNPTYYGVTHRAFVKVIGLNNKEAVLQTGWEIKLKGPVRLVTAYPGRIDLKDKISSHTSQVAPKMIVGDHKWKYIYQKAHDAGLEAAYDTIPSPLLIKGYSPEWGGECGIAWVVIPDARKGMARWLRKNDIGHPDIKSGQRVYPIIDHKELKHGDIQSIEIKRAYVKAFSQVLTANEIIHTTGSRLT